MQKTVNRKRIALLLIISVFITSTICTGIPAVRAATDLKATGRVNAASGAYIRAGASVRSRDLMVAKDNTKLVINREVFVKAGSTKAKNRWYAVTVKGVDGYIRSDLVDHISYSGVKMKTTDPLNYRVGPDVGMTRKGYFKQGAKITVVLKASLYKNGPVWYKVKKGKRYYFVDSNYVTKIKKSSKKKSSKTSTSKTSTSTSTNTSKDKTSTSTTTNTSKDKTSTSTSTNTSKDKTSTSTTTNTSKDKTSTSKTSTSTSTDKTSTSKTSTSTSTSTSSSTTSLAASAGTISTVTDKPAISKGIILEKPTYPVSITEGSPFSLTGMIKSADKITQVRVGVTETDGDWVILQESYPGTYNFDIATVDSMIRMGTLEIGTYIYRVEAKAGGKTTTLGEYKFTVVEPQGPKDLSAKAIECAWPLGTASSQYAYSGGGPTEAYTAALDVAFPDRSNWGKATRTGASCDVFISTVCRSTGYDASVPQGVQGQWTYYANSDKWSKVSYDYSESDLQSGDIVIYKKTNGNWHVCMYVQIEGKGYIAEASYKKKYGFINTSLSKILKSSDKAKLAVYRATY